LKALPSQVNIHIYDPHDNWLEKRLNEHINITTYASPSFISSKAFIDSYFDSKKTPYKHHDFYVKQRKELGILIDIAQQPIGGQWSFDKENRKKYPKK
jgi:deoxyribodipyrimidine photolyase-related protein